MAKINRGINSDAGGQADEEPDQALEQVPTRRGRGLFVRQETVGPGRALDPFLDRSHAFLVKVGEEFPSFSVAEIDCQHANADTHDNADDGNHEGHFVRFHKVKCFLLVVCVFLLSPATCQACCGL